MLILLYISAGFLSCQSTGSGTENMVVKREDILGAWTDDTAANAAFDIQADSIFYVDAMETYPYELEEDSIIIHFSDYDFRGKISVNKDTLVITEADFGPARYYRFKP
jgi:hypothetical protein